MCLNKHRREKATPERLPILDEMHMRAPSLSQVSLTCMSLSHLNLCGCHSIHCYAILLLLYSYGSYKCIHFIANVASTEPDLALIASKTDCVRVYSWTHVLNPYTLLPVITHCFHSHRFKLKSVRCNPGTLGGLSIKVSIPIMQRSFVCPSLTLFRAFVPFGKAFPDSVLLWFNV